MRDRPITIVGGGLAGLTLGIGLRQRGVPTTVWEAGTYPRHRVCGEFISGRGEEVFERLGVLSKINAAGAKRAMSVGFFYEGCAGRSLPLPRAALCLSRFRLDALLAEEFRDLGGILRENERWRGSACAEGVIRATGRSPVKVVNGLRWLGLKVHATGIELAADLEMHLVSEGYVGLCRVENDRVNICGLFRSRSRWPDLRKNGADHFRENCGASLRARLETAVLDPSSFCATSGLCYQPWAGATSEECAIGDTLTLVPPILGNGMSMAIEAAELALEPLRAFSAGERSWREAMQEIQYLSLKRFRRRLWLANRLHPWFFRPEFPSRLIRALQCWPGLFRVLFRVTR